MIAERLNKPYWITKSPYEGVAIGLRKNMEKWNIAAIQYYRTNGKEDWKAAGPGVNLSIDLFSELEKGIAAAKNNPQSTFNIRKSNDEELRIGVQNWGNEPHIYMKAFIREISTGGSEQWNQIGEEINVPISMFKEIVATIKQIHEGIEFISESTVVTRKISVKPQGRKQYYLDERGFLVSKQQWDQLHA